MMVIYWWQFKSSPSVALVPCPPLPPSSSKGLLLFWITFSNHLVKIMRSRTACFICLEVFCFHLVCWVFLLTYNSWTFLCCSYSLDPRVLLHSKFKCLVIKGTICCNWEMLLSKQCNYLKWCSGFFFEIAINQRKKVTILMACIKVEEANASII